MKKTKLLPVVLLLGVLLAMTLFAVTASAEGGAAKIGETEYATLKEAVEAVTDNTPTTITLLQDATGDGIEIPSNRTITLDLGGFTYQVTGNFVGSEGTKTNAFRFSKDSTVTVKDGTLKSTSSSAHIIIQNYSNLTLDHVTVIGGKYLAYTKYLLSCNFGDTVLKNGTKLKPVTTSQYALSVYYGMSGYEDGVSVTADSTVAFSGKVEYAKDSSATDKDFLTKAKLTISSDMSSKGSLQTYVWLSNGDGTLSPGLKTEAEAGISSVYYTKLSDALDNITSGCTVKLLKDVVLDSDLKLGTGSIGFTLDLASHTIDGGTAYQVYTAGTGLIKISGTSSGSGKIINNKPDQSASGAALFIFNGSRVQLLNGVSITGNYVAVANYGNLTVKKATLTGTTFGVGCFGSASGSSTTTFGVKNSSSNSSIAVTAGEQAIAAAVAYNSANDAVTVYGGTYTTTGLEWDDCPVYWASAGTLNIYDGTFQNLTSGTGAAALYQKEGAVNIYGGTFEAKDGFKLETKGYDVSASISGGTFKGTRSGIYVNASASVPSNYSVDVSGGTFTGGTTALYAKDAGLASDQNLMVATGGTFSSEISAAYIAENYVLNDNGDGTYTVTEKPYAAQIGDNKYDTLAEAITAAQAGDTITLLRDVAISAVDTGENYLEPQIAIDKDLTFDLAGYTIGYADDVKAASFTCTPAFFEIKSGANVIITGNGTVDCEAGNNNAYGISLNGGDLTIENGSFYGALTVAQVKTGNLLVKGGTFDLATTAKAAAPQYAKYIINAIDSNWKDGTATISVTGGTFVGADPAANPEGAGTTYVANGYISVDNGDGTYTVTESPATIVDTDATATTEVKLDDLASNSAIDHEAGATYKVVVSTAPAADVAKANETISASSDTNTNKAIFDISVIKTDSEGTSTDISGTIKDQKVTLTLEETPAADSTVHVYHVNGDTVEEITPVTVVGNTVSFTAPSFSTYAVTYSTGAQEARFGKALAIVNKPTTEYGSGTYYPIDIYCGIDTLQYKEVGVEYKLVVTGANATEVSGTKSTTVVYTKMNVTTTAGETKVYTPADLNAAYMYGQQFLFDTTKYTSADVTLIIKPYAISLDGSTTYYGNEITLSEEVCDAKGTHLFKDGQ